MAEAPLTLERMRGDVARALGVDAHEVGLEDSLIDLGLDSMRMLSLVNRWARTGIALEFSALAQYTTLGEWWKVIATLQPAGHAGR